MSNELLKLAALFRVTATQLRRLAAGPLQQDGDAVLALKAYLDHGRLRTAEAFPPDRCLETANLLEEFAATLQALTRPPD
jgi:hypothetical protein